MDSRPLICVTPGDPEGVGPEICWKAAQVLAKSENPPRLLFVGAKKPFAALGASIVEVTEDLLLSGDAKYPKSQGKPQIWLLAAPDVAPRPSRARTLLEGFQSGWSIEKATRLVQAGIASAIATGPISKERLQRGGYKYPGHTEFLAKLCSRGKKPLDVTMMLANDELRISLVTTHLGIKEVPRALTRERVRRAVSQTVSALRENWNIATPRVAVAALNPHAGESGLFGTEEIRVITPEIRALRKRFAESAEIAGPHPADTLFATQQLLPRESRYDAVVCMYHDQGLIPVKLLDFRNTVNVTLGLPIIRTSVDHGVGFDIVGAGKADPSSLLAAIRLADQLAQRKTR